MGWLEFAVVLGCGLAGFIAISAVIDARRVREDRQKDDGATKNNSESRKTQGEDRQSANDSGASRSWWETLNVERDASTEQIKSAFRREIARYHPDRVEGLGIELRQLAELKAKEVNHAYAMAKQQRQFK
jgi:DnaJ-domain-containing protein 1